MFSFALLIVLVAGANACPTISSGGCDASCPYLGQGTLAGYCWGGTEPGVSCLLQNPFQAYAVMCPDNCCSTSSLFCGNGCVTSTPTSAPTPISAPVSAPTMAPDDSSYDYVPQADVQKWESANCGCSTQNAISVGITGSNAVSSDMCYQCTSIPPPTHTHRNHPPRTVPHTHTLIETHRCRYWNLQLPRIKK